MVVPKTAPCITEEAVAIQLPPRGREWGPDTNGKTTVATKLPRARAGTNRRLPAMANRFDSFSRCEGATASRQAL